MDPKSVCQYFVKELEAESVSTRKCLERIPDTIYPFKPHEKSMEMGYLTLLVAEIPRWISTMITESVIDFATYRHFELSDTKTLLSHFEDKLDGAKKALENITDEQLAKTFELRSKGHQLYSAPMLQAIGETINHWVHHRGQLTVYMRLNNIAVPSIYGPSADSKSF